MPFKGGEGYGLQYLDKERRSEIARKGVEVRRKKKEEKMQLQRCMAALLDLPVRTEKQEQLLRDFGFKRQHDNKTLLMVSLFQKGLSGDVQAIKEITDMMEKLDMYKEGGKISGNVIINVMPVGAAYEMSEEDLQAIREAEKEGLDEEEADEWDMEDFDEEL